uniref:Spliceosome associated factor 1, recruiter of U4/U6.U5 tri-snRNP n=1 Tax=Latimeria chalumnae TaxID=7897 RepID=H3ASQ1_LATCH
SESGTSKEDPVVVEAINPIAIKQREELREKLAAMKEKRLLNQKLGKVKAIGEDDLWLDDTAAWIEKSRKLQKEKEMAEKRAKLLEEMDEEFGVSNLVQEEFGQMKQPSYTSRNLQGLTVEHKIDSFKEGETVILTLKDKGVLDEEGDILVNVNILDKERAEKNVELRKKKPDYKPYEEEESVDDMAILKPKSLLSKYDEEIEGEKKKSFKLEAGGMADGSWERELQQIREALRSQAQSLDMPQLKLESEYYTPEEMLTFKFNSIGVEEKKKKLKAVYKADFIYLFKLRARGRGRRQGSDEEEDLEEYEIELTEIPQKSDDTRVENMDISDDDEVKAPDSPVVIEEDEVELELQKQLEKRRRQKQMQQVQDSGVKVRLLVLMICKCVRGRERERERHTHSWFWGERVGVCERETHSPASGCVCVREGGAQLNDFEHDDNRSSNRDTDSDGEENLGWSAVNLDEEKKQTDPSSTSTTILDEEPIVNRGLGAALLLCKNKGLLETRMQKVARVKAPNKELPSAVYCIEDKMSIDDKYSRREEYRGFTQDFKEKDGYKPDVKIEYVDDTGRKLTPKEAFRQLSHRFHGKGSGKMKTERRMKKLEEEALLKKMSSSDTPLGTVALLQEKQKSQKTPYIVLSGSGKSMNANTITK